MKRLNCAIYTRKSSDEGLEKEFNSLDAQREACAAYVLSQKHAGWAALPDEPEKSKDKLPSAGEQQSQPKQDSDTLRSKGKQPSAVEKQDRPEKAPEPQKSKDKQPSAGEQGQGRPDPKSESQKSNDKTDHSGERKTRTEQPADGESLPRQ